MFFNLLKNCCIYSVLVSFLSFSQIIGCMIHHGQQDPSAVGLTVQNINYSCVFALLPFCWLYLAATSQLSIAVLFALRLIKTPVSSCIKVYSKCSYAISAYHIIDRSTAFWVCFLSYLFCVLSVLHFICSTYYFCCISSFFHLYTFHVLLILCLLYFVPQDFDNFLTFKIMFQL